ncbi:MAG: helix-turn-helix domain-containing protein [Clostridiales bacterium]|nr:helix-turn-helix domain-containing protein [Clostridiales bacterium]
MDEDIGTRIRILRLQNNWTHADLSLKIGLSQSALSTYERGIRIPDANTLFKFCKLFNCSADYLVGLTDVVNHEAWEDATSGINSLLADDLRKFPFGVTSLVVKSIHQLSEAYGNAGFAGSNFPSALLECYQAEVDALCEFCKILPQEVGASGDRDSASKSADAYIHEISINFKTIAILEEMTEQARKFFGAARKSAVSYAYDIYPRPKFVVSGNGEITELPADPAEEATSLSPSGELLRQAMMQVELSDDKADGFFAAMRQTMLGMGAREDLVNAAIEEAREKRLKKGDEQVGGKDERKDKQ